MDFEPQGSLQIHVIADPILLNPHPTNKQELILEMKEVWMSFVDRYR